MRPNKTRQAPRWESSTVQGSPGDYGDAGQKGYPGVSTAARPQVSLTERLTLERKVDFDSNAFYIDLKILI